MNKQHTFIVGSGQRGFSVSNDTDTDPMTDYSPGAWGISKKFALEYAKEKIAIGDIVRVSTYDNPNHAATGNAIIAELGIDQPLFPLPETVAPSNVTNDKPATLAQLKRYCAEGVKIHMKNRFNDVWLRECDTYVKRVGSNSIVLDSDGRDSWLEWGKASDWSFDNEGATNTYINNQTGARVPCLRVEYLAE